ncbi:MAG: radical SAM protein [bacterium]
MLTGIHFLLTYKCTYECDHCFLYCSPDASGTFTLSQIKDVLADADKIGTIEWIYFEGGEPFLYFPLMVEGIRLAKQHGFKVGVVTNCYWATDPESATLWLRALQELEIDDLSMSDDPFHYEGDDISPAQKAVLGARNIGMDCDTICIEAPAVLTKSGIEIAKGAPVIGGSARFRGRAVEKLTAGLPTRPIDSFVTCPYEELEKPERVHLDNTGNVHICQGISMGNMWDIPLSELIDRYAALQHPITGPLVAGGPTRLAQSYPVRLEGNFVDECHYCFAVRSALRTQFPELLGPPLVYGVV